MEPSIDTSEHLEWVRMLTRRFLDSFSIRTEEFDELLGAAMLGLVEAAERYDESHGVEFRAFAKMRVRGALLDGLSSLSGLSRAGYRKARALRALTNYQSEEEIKRSADLSPDQKLANVFADAASAAFVHRLSVVSDEGEEFIASEAETPEDIVGRNEQIDQLKKHIELLPENERVIMTEYYFHNKSFGEIGSLYDMSKGWISRVHKRALENLQKSILSEEDNEH